MDAIVCGHTHLTYNCPFPVTGWSSQPIKDRPVVSAGQYGMQLDQLVFSFDTAGNPVAVVQQTPST